MNIYLNLIKLASFTTCSRLNSKIDWNKTSEVNISFNPVITYNNADLDKSIIMEDNRNKVGVYRWVNVINNKAYVGSSTNLSERFLDYYQSRILLKNKTPIHNALLKYGYSNFRLEILEYCIREKAILREPFYFDLLKPDYNILKIAGSSLGYIHREDTIERMKTIHLLDEEVRKNRIKARLGFKASVETRKKNSAATTALLGIPVVVKNVNTGEETEYVNLTEAGKALGVSRTAVKKSLDLNKCINKTYSIRKKI